MNTAFWKDKRVFITGHTGFKGSWLCLWLRLIGAKITGYALAPEHAPNLFEAADVARHVHSFTADIRDGEYLAKVMSKTRPDIVIHMAAQSLVRRSYRQPLETYSVNIMGTVHLLEAVRRCDSIQSVLVITSDKCYENRGNEHGCREQDPMGGFDPYSSSKGCVELVTASYRRSFFDNGEKIGLATARAGNVIGGGDWSQDRLIPDMVRSFTTGRPVVIRNPAAIRPWQHVFDALHGYMQLLEKISVTPKSFSQAWNFGPEDSDSRTVKWITERFAAAWDNAAWQAASEPEALHEERLLRLDCSKAKRELAWQPVLDINEALQWTIAWYRDYFLSRDMRRVSQEQVERYMQMVT